MKIHAQKINDVLYLVEGADLTVHQKIATAYHVEKSTAISLYGKDVLTLLTEKTPEKLRLESVTYMIGLQGDEQDVNARVLEATQFFTILAPRSGTALFEKYLSFLKDTVLQKATGKRSYDRTLKLRTHVVYAHWMDGLLVSISFTNPTIRINTLNQLAKRHMALFRQ